MRRRKNLLEVGIVLIIIRGSVGTVCRVKCPTQHVRNVELNIGGRNNRLISESYINTMRLTRGQHRVVSNP